jgi:predicted ATPase
MFQFKHGITHYFCLLTNIRRSGKTRLVQCAIDAAVAARGLVVQKKFEVNSTNQLYLVLSAFNNLCEQLAKNYYGSAKGGTANIWHQLVMEFGSSLHMLANILPNIIRLTPSPAAAFSLVQGTKGDVNFFSLCDIIKRFMRVISATSLPVIMVLDDLQWSDSVSLGLVHAVLSDRNGASCLFFVGCYRDNEVDQHHILHGFHNWLSASDVPSSTIHLGGISQEDVLALVSDSLGMLPRLCLSLSQVIYRKTEGNPLFVQTFLRSLGEYHTFEHVSFMATLRLNNVSNVFFNSSSQSISEC